MPGLTATSRLARQPERELERAELARTARGSAPRRTSSRAAARRPSRRARARRRARRAGRGRSRRPRPGSRPPRSASRSPRSGSAGRCRSRGSDFSFASAARRRRCRRRKPTRQPAIEKRLGQRVELDRALVARPRPAGSTAARGRRRRCRRRRSRARGRTRARAPKSTSRCMQLGRRRSPSSGCAGRRRSPRAASGQPTLERLLDARDAVVAVLDRRVHDASAPARRGPTRCGSGSSGSARRRVARLEQHPHQVAEALLGADRVDDISVSGSS